MDNSDQNLSNREEKANSSQEPPPDEIPKKGVLVLETESTREKGQLIRKITSDFQFTKIPTKTVYLLKTSTNDDLTYFIFYEQADRKTTSPWKGMASYYAARSLFETAPNSAHPLLWILERVTRELKNMNKTGISVKYRMEADNSITVMFYLEDSKIYRNPVTTAHAWHCHYMTKGHIVLKSIIMGPFQGEKTEDRLNRKNERDFEKFFDYLKAYKKKHQEKVPKFKLNSKNMKSKLMDYQVDTVRWMLHREVKETFDYSEKVLEYHKIPDTDLLFYPYIGVVCREEPNELDHEISMFDKLCTVKGGILADEMGLGKTVQVLSLIATHQRETSPVVLSDEEAAREEHNAYVAEIQENEEDKKVDMERIATMSFAELSTARASTSTMTYNIPPKGTREDTIQCHTCKQFCLAEVCGIRDITRTDEFVCPECIDKKEHKLPIKTTLIVVPDPLVFQWYTEVQKHCSTELTVMFYFGVRKHGYIQPTELEKYDVILTTYDAMRIESLFKDRKNLGERSFRSGTPSLYVTSPLTHVNFWRVVLDESQAMPQGLNSNIGRMLMSINSEHWWCVTGTPLVKTISDLHPLLAFLDILPFSISEYFNDTVLPEYLHLVRTHRIDSDLPFNLLLDILSKCLSRKTKAEVGSQIAIPGLEEIEKVIMFTAIEERQYKEEKERLMYSVAYALRNCHGDELLRNVKAREKVLQELRTLKETILTGQNHRADLKTSGCIYAPETVIFRLVVSKKKKLLEKFRLFMMAANGLAGAYLLANKKREAEEAYQFGLNAYSDIIGIEEYVITTVGVDKIKSLCGSDEEFLEERFDGDEEEDFEPRRKERQFTVLWREVMAVKRRYKIEPPKSTEPVAKRAKVEEPTDEEQREAMLRQKIGKRLARLALKPLRMDVTQEVHLVLNLHMVQKELESSVIDSSRVEPLLERAYGVDATNMSKLRKELNAIGEAMNQNDLITRITSYIKDHSSNNPDVLHSKHDLVPQVEHMIVLLPVNLLFEEQTANTKPPPKKHTESSCMGGCQQIEPSQYVGMKNRVLRVSVVLEKLCEWLEGVEKQRVEVVGQMDRLMGLVEKMAAPKTLIKLLTTREDSYMDRTTKQMMMLFKCNHTIVKGTIADRGVVQMDKKICPLCDVFVQLNKILYDAGFISFHGSERTHCSVDGFVDYLVSNLIHRADKAAFLDDTLWPFFRRTKDLVAVYKTSIVNMVLELINTFHEFYQAKSTITAERVTAELGISMRADMRGNFDAYAAKMVAARTSHKKKFTSELRELRYLITLMNEQLVGEATAEECPVCQTVMESFMVYTCGHRVCPECFEHLRTRARYADMNNDRVSCPTCRMNVNGNQVMLARSGFAEQNAIIPGMVTSAKLTTAIQLMRQIIASDEKNKIIVFTQVDPSCTRVWQYLQMVFRLAKIPFVAVTRNQFGKKIIDFDLGGENKVLLCSFSLCANGLNITGANHIIFMDPPHQKSVLDQAMGRINRFGQKSAMKVYHIVVEGSLDVELRESAKTKTVEDEKKGWTVRDVRRMFDVQSDSVHGRHGPSGPQPDDERNNRAFVGQFADDRWQLLLDDGDDDRIEVLVRDPMGEIQRENRMWEQIRRRREMIAAREEVVAPAAVRQWDGGALDQIDMGVDVNEEQPFGMEEFERMAPILDNLPGAPNDIDDDVPEDDDQEDDGDVRD